MSSEYEWTPEGGATQAEHSPSAPVDPVDGATVTDVTARNIQYDVSTGTRGCHPWLVSLANTAEPLFVVNRSGNRPSADGAAERLDQALGRCRDAGFRRVTFRGDTDFAQMGHLDRWGAAGVRSVFGSDARANVIRVADALSDEAWTPLERPARHTVQTTPHQRPKDVKATVIVERGFKNVRLEAEAVAECPYQRTVCAKPHRMVVLRKSISVEKGAQRLFDEIRSFFYLTNDRTTAPAEIVFLAHDRCNQENLIDQLTHGVRAMGLPVDSLLSNGAYMAMAALAWTLKAWFALLLPVSGRWAARHTAEKQAVLRMEFKAFLQAFLLIPAQVVRTSRRMVFRLLAWNPWQADIAARRRSSPRPAPVLTPGR
jgi:hypothetical protein